MDRTNPPPPNEGTPRDVTNPGERTTDVPVDREGATPDREPNPPRTTKGGITAPKFGSAGSGGAELEPGPPKP